MKKTRASRMTKQEFELLKNVLSKNLSPNIFMIIAVRKLHKIAIFRKTDKLKAL